MQWSWLKPSTEPVEQVIGDALHALLFAPARLVFASLPVQQGCIPLINLVPATPPDLTGKALVVALEMIAHQRR